MKRAYEMLEACTDVVAIREEYRHLRAHFPVYLSQI